MKYANTTETMENTTTTNESSRQFRWFNVDKFFDSMHSAISDEGKVSGICNQTKSLLNDALEKAPEFLSELPNEREIQLTPEQKLGNASREMLFKSRRRALERSDLDETTKFNKARQIDDSEQVIKESVALLAKGKYATKTEIRNMIARITAAESGIGYEQHEPGIDEAVQRMVTNITNGTTNERAFTFEEALNHAMENASFNI